MTIKSLCPSFKHWMHTPINFKEERLRLAVISCAVLAIFILGTICYFYVGGKFSYIPGYNPGYAYFLWTLGTLIALTAVTTYLVKNVLSTTSIRSKNEIEQNFDFSSISLQSSLGMNPQIKTFTQNIHSSILELSSDESLNFDMRDYCKNKKAAFRKMLPIFENKQTPLLACRQVDNSWLIAARIHCRVPDGTQRDGVFLISQNTHNGPGSSWSVFCTIEGLEEIRNEFRDITLDKEMYPQACRDFSWIKSILEGKRQKLSPLTGEAEGEISLWQPHLS